MDYKRKARQYSKLICSVDQHFGLQHYYYMKLNTYYGFCTYMLGVGQWTHCEKTMNGSFHIFVFHFHEVDEVTDAQSLNE